MRDFHELRKTRRHDVRGANGSASACDDLQRITLGFGASDRHAARPPEAAAFGAAVFPHADFSPHKSAHLAC